MNIAEFSIRKNLFVNLLSGFFIVAGIFALFRLNREAFPNFSMDIVTVRADYHGATPEQVEKLIIMPLEKELKAVSDIKEMTSVAIENLGLVILEIEHDAKNKDRIVNDIQRSVDRTTDLPQDMKDKPAVNELTTKDNPVIEVALSGDITEDELQKYAKSAELKILELPDVSSVSRKGWRDKEIWVEVDPAKMADYRLSLEDVAQSLALQNINVPGGKIVTGRKEYLLRTSGEFETVDEIKKVIVRSNDAGNALHIEEIADVKPAFADEATITRTFGTRSINLVVIKKERGDTITLVKDIKKIMEEFKKGAPAELKVSYANDISYYIKRRLNVLVNNGFLGMILVIVSMFLFLSHRTAIGAVVGIPTALLTALAILYWMGLSINLITMFGMIMVIGMLVDEDIVVAENIHHHLETGENIEKSVIRGATEISKAVFATVLTTVSAFVPLMFVTGMIGKFIKYIPIVVIVTLAASLLEAVLVLPSHLFALAKAKGSSTNSQLVKPDPKRKRWMPDFSRGMRSLQDRYLHILKKALAHKYKVLAATVAVTIFAGYLALAKIGFVLFPTRGIEIFFIRAEADIGMPIEETEKLMQPVEREIAKLPPEELDTFVTNVGITQNDPHDPFTRRASNVAQIVVYLTPESKRSRTAEEIIESLRPGVSAVRGFQKLSFERVKPGPPVGKSVEIMIKGEDYKILNKIKDEVKSYLASLKGVSDVDDDYGSGKEEMRVVLDEPTLAKAGLSPSKAAMAVRSAFAGETATTIKTGDEEIDVVVRLPYKLKYSADSLEKVLIPNKAEGLVPLMKISKNKISAVPETIKHVDAKRTISVTADIDEKEATAVGVAITVAKKFGDISSKYPGYLIRYGGEYEETSASIKSLYYSLALAILMILVILILTFNSLVYALIILTTIPLGFVGIILAFGFHGMTLSFMALLGAVGLSGVVVDSAIVICDLVHCHRKEGKSMEEAIMLACGRRLRPIILVTLTTVLGIIPSAYGIGGNDPFIQPMALALNWGLTFAAVLTLIVIPCLIMAGYELKSFILRAKSRR